MEMKQVGPAPLHPNVAKRLLDLLSTDDAFRALFVADVNAALAQAGYVVPEGADETFAGPGNCLNVAKLASKESIANARAELERQFSLPFSFLPSLALTGG